MQELAKIDKEMFQETFVDLQYFEAKTGRRPNANERKEVILTHMRMKLIYCVTTVLQNFCLLIYYQINKL